MRKRFLTMAGAVALLTSAIAGGTPAQSRVLTPDNGQFWERCYHADYSYLDPIVYYGGIGDHEHDFFGNEEVADDSDGFSLMSGDTNCEDQGAYSTPQSHDHSAWWFPTLWIGEPHETGSVRVAADKMVIYYRTGGIDSSHNDEIIRVPTDLQMIAGTPSRYVTEYGPEVRRLIANWSCDVGTFDPVIDVEIPDACGAGEDETGDLRLGIKFPNCWDGSNLHAIGATPASIKQQSHVEYAWYGDEFDPTDLEEVNEAQLECPESHDTYLPSIVVTVFWDGGDFPPLGGGDRDYSGVWLSNHDPVGTTMHMDLINSWTEIHDPGKSDDDFALLTYNCLTGLGPQGAHNCVNNLLEDED